jgi:hypothetical protein
MPQCKSGNVKNFHVFEKEKTAVHFIVTAAGG